MDCFGPGLGRCQELNHARCDYLYGELSGILLKTQDSDGTRFTRFTSQLGHLSAAWPTAIPSAYLGLSFPTRRVSQEPSLGPGSRPPLPCCVAGAPGAGCSPPPPTPHPGLLGLTPAVISARTFPPQGHLVSWMHPFLEPKKFRNLRHIRLRVGEFQPVDPWRGMFGCLGETFYFGIILDVLENGKGSTEGSC